MRDVCIAFFGHWLENHTAIDLGPKWSIFIDELDAQGYSLVLPSMANKDVPIIVIDATPSVLLDIRRLGLNRKRCTLLRVEPRAVNPFQYQVKMKRYFSQTFCPTEDQVTLDSDRIWQSGYLSAKFSPSPKATQSLGSRTFSFGMINQNKFSCVDGELYDLRRKVIGEFAKKRLPLSVAGKDWQRNLVWFYLKYAYAAFIAIRAGLVPIFRYQNSLRKLEGISFVGRVESEIDYLSDCEVALVIENEQTYASEKLLNALLAGCKVVYVGPKMDLSKFVEGQIIHANPNSSDIVVKALEALSREIDDDEYSSWIQQNEYFEAISVEEKFRQIIATVFSGLS